ncbi:MAG: VWA domain-containing protein [Proteobacteria bacterium]|jgi:nitric oxide reductase NorD protein|nr:VWA domain-containing protein [Pseudomonadota bacterium]
MRNPFHTIHRMVEFEEHVGLLWHRLITRSACQCFPKAAVRLEEVRFTVGILFRALGGDGGLKIETAMATEHGARRSWLQRVAGSHRQVELGWRNDEALHLPAVIDVFPDIALNRDLYLWLAALASGDTRIPKDWFVYNQWLSCRVLKRFPGLADRYMRLVKAQLALRPDPDALPDDEAEQERAIQAALLKPGSVSELPSVRSPLQPVYLWLHPAPPASGQAAPITDEDATPEAGGEVVQPEEVRRYRAEQVEMPDGQKGLVLDRFENIFSWAEYVKVDRTTDEDEDLATAEDTARDLDKLSVARDSRTTAKRIRFDLDLPAAGNDDTPLGDGILYPEWDYRKSRLVTDYCRIQPMVALDAEPVELPVSLRATARHLRGQFEALVPQRVWYRAQQEGSEIDLEALLIHTTERRIGHAVAEQGLYRDFRGGQRDLACLLLADLSLSTDAWVNNHARIIDVIRDSLMLFAEAMSATGDQFAMYGFSSRRREHVRFHTLKSFSETHTARSRGRIQQIKPGFYTRMGAAIRHASTLLASQPTSQRLLLLLTDGKPNDLDLYEGRYGIEDTRMALIEARRQGLQPFCVTIDQKAGDYLPHLFGSGAYVVIRKPSDLPRELPLLYARLTQ